MDTLWYVLVGVFVAVLWLLVIVCYRYDKCARSVAQMQQHPAGAAGGAVVAQAQLPAGGVAPGQAQPPAAGAAAAGGAAAAQVPPAGAP